MRKLLIITSMYTGHGHKSIAEALAERLSAYDDIEVKIIDGFALMNRFEQYMAEYTYGPITRMPGKAWEWNFAAGMTFRKPVITVVGSIIRARLLSLLDSFQPDAILSAHPIFLGTVLDVMRDAGLDIPLIAIADLPELAKESKFFADLAEICGRHKQLWSLEAEQYLLANAEDI